MKKILLIFLSLYPFLSFSQTDSSRLNGNFRFKDGIFLDFKQVINNSPIPRSDIITNIPKWDINFYEKLFKNNAIELIYQGHDMKISINDIWGYSDDGILYIHWKDDFAKIANKGALSYFAATEQTINYNDPYTSMFYDDPFTPYDATTRTSRELREYIIDFKTGKIYPFTKESLLNLFKQYDTQLYVEYKKLRSRKQKKLKFVYLLKFNRRNKIFIHNSSESNY